ncbi:hypothetical protein ACSBR1_004659 [Camellia fascicularis]
MQSTTTFEPDKVTIVSVLPAIANLGALELGNWVHQFVRRKKLDRATNHYGCMVDLLGRAGCLEEAEKLIESMPYEANGIILSSLLFACGYAKDVTRAERIRQKVIKMEPWNDGNYVMLRNLYAKERRWRDVEEIKGEMSRGGAKKAAGCSVIEVDSRVWEFIAGGLPSTQMFNYAMGTVYDQLMEKEINDFEDFHKSLLDLFSSFNASLPGKRYDAPLRKEIEACFTKWKGAADEKERKKVFTEFMRKEVKICKLDNTTLIVGLVMPPAAMGVKRAGESVPQLSLIKSIPDVVFVPSATVLALVSAKLSRRIFSGHGAS